MITAVANGRVNLIGEHTDYNDGWVLPTAIPQKTTVKLTPRQDKTVIARTSMSVGETRFELGQERAEHKWTDYIQGATRLLAKAGHSIRGFEIEIDSTVPTGSGLSSSAALEIAVTKALREAFQLKLTDVELAKLGQRIENEFVGARVGIMDQMACALANFGEALFLDTQSLEFERVKLPMDELDLIVINSGVEHRHAGGGYNQRRSECEAAVKALGIKSLREANLDQVESSSQLGAVEKKRARHVVTENRRVHDAVRAIKSGDLVKLGHLFLESHQSMKLDYEVSVPEIDLLVELCRAKAGVFGARLTGGGFGGSIVAIAKKGQGLGIARDVAQSYTNQTSNKATVLVPDDN